MDRWQWQTVACGLMAEAKSGARQWQPTDHRVVVARNTDRIPSYKGEHLWTWTALFRAQPGTETPMLDSENLLQIAGIACLYCGIEHTRAVAGRFCKGGGVHS